MQILREHVEHCVGGAMSSGRKAAVQQKLDELFVVMSKFGA
jgi:DNA-binding FrmR family transcriptional regulator